jgi:chromosome segregation ATPase
VLTSTLSTSHERINALKNDLEMLRSELARTTEALEVEKSRASTLAAEKSDVTGDLTRAMGDLVAIEKEIQPGSQIIDHADQLFSKPAKAIMARVSELKNKELGLFEMTNYRDTLLNNIEELKTSLESSHRQREFQLGEQATSHEDALASLTHNFNNEIDVLKARMEELDASWNAKCRALIDERDGTAGDLSHVKTIVHDDLEERSRVA